ncbi:MAG TPA: hypothetical protein DDW94_00720 [Deltaproteobacteria bacterium]|nr:hypothetical protein [Deltaproteobacteria bacterium]HCY10323.1 hypothetical protein [Deltaproteobacteria bacterium]
MLKKERLPALLPGRHEAIGLNKGCVPWYFYLMSVFSRKNKKAYGVARGAACLRAAITVVLALFVFSGCASIPEGPVRRDAREIYDGAVNAYLSGNLQEADRSFKMLMEEYPLSPYSQESELMLGDVSYAMESYEDASSYYTNFVALHPAHIKAPYALFQKGMSHFKDVLTLDRDQASTKKALFAFEDLIAAYPGSPYVATAKDLSVFMRNRLAEREFYIARFYFKQKKYKGALGRLRDILTSYTDAGITDKTLYFIGESYIGLGEKELANEAFSTLITNYPGSPYARDAKGRMGEV